MNSYLVAVFVHSSSWPALSHAVMAVSRTGCLLLDPSSGSVIFDKSLFSLVHIAADQRSNVLMKFSDLHQTFVVISPERDHIISSMLHGLGKGSAPHRKQPLVCEGINGEKAFLGEEGIYTERNQILLRYHEVEHLESDAERFRIIGSGSRLPWLKPKGGLTHHAVSLLVRGRSWIQLREENEMLDKVERGTWLRKAKRRGWKSGSHGRFFWLNRTYAVLSWSRSPHTLAREKSIQVLRVEEIDREGGVFRVCSRRTPENWMTLTAPDPYTYRAWVQALSCACQLNSRRRIDPDN
eukprot:gb/GECH01010990.1/.p1 GENE.gb/GECH01010990.1/~~gb/GECH01010990.1/.p1  ORF type:complete len:295 (+),score=25.82 gb/GECH01010990.1/:1-885(+)